MYVHVQLHLLCRYVYIFLLWPFCSLGLSVSGLRAPNIDLRMQLFSGYYMSQLVRRRRLGFKRTGQMSCRSTMGSTTKNTWQSFGMHTFGHGFRMGSCTSDFSPAPAVTIENRSSCITRSVLGATYGKPRVIERPQKQYISASAFCSHVKYAKPSCFGKTLPANARISVTSTGAEIAVEPGARLQKNFVSRRDHFFKPAFRHEPDDELRLYPGHHCMEAMTLNSHMDGNPVALEIERRS